MIICVCQKWKALAKNLEELWHFPQCIGVLDGKHILIEPPQHSGSKYLNYKWTHSLVLMMLVDAELKFTYIDVGTNRRVIDGGVWKKCGLYKALNENSLQMPPPNEYLEDN